MRVILLVLCLALTGCVFLKMDLKPKDELEEQFVMGEETAKEKILLIPIEGVIFGDEDTNPRNGTTSAKIKEMLQKARKDQEIKAIILEIDSPGGGVTASDRIYNYLKEFKAQRHLPIIAFMKDTAASGGYYVALSADYIMAHPTSITGSIGVISVFVTAEDLLKWAQLEVVVIKSGGMKDAGSPLRRMKPQEREYLQNIIDEMYNGFLGIVAAGRQKVLTSDQIKPLADGRVFTGKQALEHKLVDGLGQEEDVIKKAKEMAGLKQAKVVRYRKLRGALETAFSASGGPPKSDLTQLRELLLQNNTTRFMYLWLPGAE